MYSSATESCLNSRGKNFFPCIIYKMASTDIADNVNFSLLIQEIPGTFNRYDREIIHKDMNLQFPKKLAINNWPDETRWKPLLNFLLDPEVY